MKKKIFLFVILVVIISSMVFALTGCEFGGTDGKPSGKHDKHTWATAWTTDSTHHWHKCTGCDQITGKAEHVFADGKCVCGASDEIEGEDGLIYKLNDSKNAYIVYDMGAAANKTIITVPDKFKGLPVESIDYAFYKNTNIQELYLPNSIKTVSYIAFDGCTNLKFNEYGNINYLGNKDNPYLVAVSPIDKELSTATLHNDTKVITNFAFYQYSALTSIEIPRGVTSISQGAFALTGLTQVTLHDNITEICYAGFNGCKFVSLELPDSITRIDKQAFLQNRQLERIKLPNNLVTIGMEAFAGCFALKEITIPDSVTTIGDKAFRNSTGVTTIKMSKNIVSIGVEAFTFAQITEITLPVTIKSIGSDIFKYSSISVINYEGSSADWNAVSKDDWDLSLTAYTVKCTDKDIVKE